MILERSSREVYPQKTLSTTIQTSDKIDLALRTQSLSNLATTLKSQGSVNEDVASSKKLDTMGPETDRFTTTTTRDVGVTDDEWCQLENDKLLANAKEKEYSCLNDEEEQQKKKILKLKEEGEKAARELEDARGKADEDAKRRHEQDRLQHELERRR
ncbi:hypothetical protein N7536_005824 [Penicillium majusculum]|nr:hypothetical protein N7536_005824 [Penicillium majusculum]